MSKIKMTQTIARILAERAKKQIETSLDEKAQVIKTNLMNSKEYKLLEKNVAQMTKLRDEQHALVTALQKNFEAPPIDVTVSVYRDEISVRARATVYASVLMDNILINAHFADSGTTEEDLVKDIVAFWHVHHGWL